METIKLGLIRGRHDLPVEEYIFDSVDDVLDFDKMETEIVCFLTENGYNFHKRIVCYVTGLTAAATALVKVCMSNGIPLTLMHFDRETGTYVPQEILRECEGNEN